MKATNKKTEQDVMAEYREIIEQGGCDEFLHIATTVEPKDADYLKYVSERDGKVTTHYLTVSAL
ncbi:hypothetical protein [Synechocystis sp. PCC 7509]|uniref:hypothetical protein n=1 Tax=Synechocystis sp. PCC 7509 TaxID=927677 RepID=UPI0002ABE3AB|nr:hypothetical protein [Synechocystis sp. PCC 7509]